MYNLKFKVNILLFICNVGLNCFTWVLLGFSCWPLLSIKPNLHVRCYIVYSNKHTRAQAHSCPWEMSSMVNFTTQSNVQSHPPQAARHRRADRNRHGLSNWLSWSFQHIIQKPQPRINCDFIVVTGDASIWPLIYTHSWSFIFHFSHLWTHQSNYLSFLSYVYVAKNSYSCVLTCRYTIGEALLPCIKCLVEGTICKMRLGFPHSRLSSHSDNHKKHLGWLHHQRPVCQPLPGLHHQVHSARGRS